MAKVAYFVKPFLLECVLVIGEDVWKRDYVYVSDLPDAQTVMAQLEGWFNDYNENAPHKGLKMRSPWQFLKETGSM